MDTVSTPVLFDDYMLLVLGIMIAMGILAGIANYFLSSPEAKQPIKFIVLGVVAALTVPLFLNMTSSNLLEFGRTRPNSLFVFAGFCLIYVLLSRRLFENIALKLMQMGHKTPEMNLVNAAPRTREDFFQAGLSTTDIEIMRAVSLGGSVYENLSSQSQEGVPTKEFVNDRLVLLRQLGLLELRANERNILHMCLSSAGAKLLNEVAEKKAA